MSEVIARLNKRLAYNLNPIARKDYEMAIGEITRLRAEVESLTAERDGLQAKLEWSSQESAEEGWPSVKGFTVVEDDEWQGGYALVNLDTGMKVRCLTPLERSLKSRLSAMQGVVDVAREANRCAWEPDDHPQPGLACCECWVNLQHALAAITPPVIDKSGHNGTECGMCKGEERFSHSLSCKTELGKLTRDEVSGREQIKCSCNPEPILCPDCGGE